MENIYMVSLKATTGDKEGFTEVYYGVAKTWGSAGLTAMNEAKKDGYDKPEIIQIQKCGKRAF